jgi:acyl-CoA thioesterase FadM
MAKPFVVHITAREYEVDANGHVAGSVLLQYGQHARETRALRCAWQHPAF